MSINIGYLDVYEPDERLDINVLLDRINQRKQDELSAVKNQWAVEYLFEINKEEEKRILVELVERYVQAIDGAVNDIDYIIYCQGDSDCNRLEQAYYIQSKFKMKNARVFALNQGCSGVVEAINVASELVKGKVNSRILILASIFTECDEERLVGPTVLSDGIGILEVSSQSSGIYEILDSQGKTNGEVTEGNFFTGSSSAKIVKNGSKLVEEIVERNNLTLEDVTEIVPLSTCRSVWELHCDMLQYPIEKVFLENIPHGGHIGTVDTIRNLKTVLSRGIVSQGEYVVCYGISFGTSWGASLLRVL